MSIVRLRKVFRKKIHFGIGKRKISFGSPIEIIFWGIVVVFLVGTYYTFGGPGDQGGPRQEGAPRSVTKSVAAVAGHTISRMEFETQARAMMGNMSAADTLTRARQMKTSLLDSMVRRLLMLDAAKSEGLKVSRADVDAKVTQLVDQQVDGRFKTRKALAKYLARKQLTLDQYKAELRAERLENREGIEEQVKFERLEDLVKSTVKLSDKDIKEHYTKVKARHILIMPEQLEQEDVGGEDEGEDAEKPKPAKKTKDYKALAKKRIQELLKSIKDGEDFADVARESSHDFSSAVQGGMLHSSRPPPPGPDGETPEPSEYFGHGEMVPEFDAAVFALKKGETSDPIETDYGYHIIQVMDRKVEWPPDYKDNKDEHNKLLLEEAQYKAWNQYIENLTKSSPITYEDPELAAYKALSEDKKPEAAQLLAKAVQSDGRNVGAKYELAMLLKDTDEKDQAIKYLRELAESDQASRAPQVHVDLGDLLVEKKMNSEALAEYKIASEWAVAYDYPSMFIHQDLRMKFEELDEEEAAQKEQEWLEAFQKHQQEAGMGGFGGGMPITMPPMPDAGPE